ncbi:hypothetical protein tinsulaeT_04420 [Thalassotalea insulae]|uniref:Thermostable hemolysin n=1 Tax=Thalassotalea insulae TaxID=2056778 RepID=A0ABQ6GR91_9GAMM|nr:thermostable hemolysin [Thalassotalea insulae]GLX77102.1 hypothetical protein tinsulaeT_04420 [Thalassotalea insulae]
MLTTHAAHNETCAYNSRKVTSTPVTVALVAQQDSARQSVEQFILQGYQKAFRACFSEFMPQLITLTKGKHCAALGLRNAQQPLFIEQYLAAPIETLTLFSSQQVARSQIVEIGNLYSNAKPLTLPLFLLTAVALFINEQRYMVFAGTEQVLSLIQSTGITPTVICPAKAEYIQNREDNWGRYYETNPNVVAVDLQQVVKVINRTPRYSKMFEQLSDEIAQLSQTLSLHLPFKHTGK